MSNEATNQEHVQGLAVYKVHLLAALQTAYDAGPKDQPFDAGMAWSRIERAARSYEFRDNAPAASTSVERVKRHKRLAATLKEAHDLLAGPMAADDLLEAGWKPLGYFSEEACSEFKRAVDGIAKLQAAAEQAANEAHQGPGRRKSSPVSPIAIRVLAEVYRDSTGTRATVTEGGSFHVFVWNFFQALSIEGDHLDPDRLNLAKSTILKALKAAHAKARRTVGLWGRPFLG